MTRIVVSHITKKVTIGGREFVLSALPIGPVRFTLWPLSDDLASGKKTTSEAMDDMVALILQSLQPSEPELTEADIHAGLLPTDIWTLFREVGQVSGMSRADAGAPSGEA